MLVAVAVENDGSLAKLLLQTIGVEPRLLLAHTGIALGALRLNQSQRLAVVSPKDIIDKALALIVGHAGHRILAVLLLIQRPA